MNKEVVRRASALWYAESDPLIRKCRVSASQLAVTRFMPWQHCSGAHHTSSPVHSSEVLGRGALLAPPRIRRHRFGR